MKLKMGSHPPNIRIGIFGHYGNTNMGDEATIQAVIQNIRKRLPEASISCFSLRPEDTGLRYQVPAFPIRRTVLSRANELPTEAPSERSFKNEGKPDGLAMCKRVIKNSPLLYGIFRLAKRLISNLARVAPEIRFLLQSRKILKNVDLLLITGSNQFVDNFGGPWLFPYNLLKWSFLARTTRTRVRYISVGAGPITSKLSYTFIRWALKFQDYLSFRDEASKRLIEETGYRGRTYVYPDLAHSLDLSIPEPGSNPGAAARPGKPVIGINPMPLFDSRYWCEDDSQAYRNFVRILADFSSQLLSEGYPVFFFPTQRKDEAVIDDIVDLLGPNAAGLIEKANGKRKSPSVNDCMANILSADIIVATRFHGVALSLRAEKPVVAICYFRKTKDLMRDMGQDAYALNFDVVSASSLWKSLKDLELNRNNEIVKIKERGRAYRLSLDEQYDRLFPSSK
jgi:polysaccharide pyruvyl transferase WcaK-like protein